MIMSLKRNINKMKSGLFIVSITGLMFITGSVLSAEESIFDSAYNLDSIDQSPSILSAPAPKYPFKGVAEGIEGRVLLRFVVDSNGIAREPDVVEAEPEGVFEESALNAIINYRFKPAVKDGKNVACIVLMPVKFSLGYEDKKIFDSAYRLSEVDQPPKLIYGKPPEYPDSAKEQGIEGQVIVRIVIGVNGFIHDTKILSSIPQGFFDEAVLKALSETEFEPAVKDGQEVDCVISVPIGFPPKNQYLSNANETYE